MELVSSNKNITILTTLSDCSLGNFPSEILINIFSNLDERDLYSLQIISKRFYSIINDEELWKNLFSSKFRTNTFPSFTGSNKFSIEFINRKYGLHEWKHNKSVRTKYTISSGSRVTSPIGNILFDYPRCLCYSDGVITILQLQQFKKSRGNRARLTYIPCTTPQGCSTLHFDLNSAVFGRFDGRLFGKILNNKSYLQHVVEFDSQHSSAVTAIGTIDTSENFCVSGSENGEIIWWKNAKKVKAWKVSNNPILRLSIYREWTIIMDQNSIYVIHSMKELNSIQIPSKTSTSVGETPIQVQFFNIDFGSKSIIIGDTTSLYVISFNPFNNMFGFTRTIEFEKDYIEEVVLDEVTSKKEQDLQLAGGNGCFMAIKLHSNTAKIINIRASGPKLVIQTDLSFNENEILYTCQVTNLVVVCVLNGFINVYDALSGELIKVIQKTEKNPTFLRISQGRLLVSNNENVIHYLKFIPDEKHDSGRSGNGNGSSTNRNSNKWRETLNTELQIYDEELELNERQRIENNRLLNLYGGDIEHDIITEQSEEHDLQFRIALLESEADSNMPSLQMDDQDNEEMRRAIEESQRIFENNTLPSVIDNLDNQENGIEDEELMRAIEASRLQEENRLQEIGSSTDTAANIANTSEINNVDDDEAFQLAIALSLSEMNS